MSPREYTGGFFNHYDDPDEFWDEDPLVVVSPTRPRTLPAPAPAPKNPEQPRSSTPPQPSVRKSSLVEVQCGLDRLPVSITLKAAWKNAFAPQEYGQSIMDAYHFSVQELAVKLVESGTVPPATIPSMRDAAPLLLRTRTLAEYDALYNELFTQPVHEVHGQGRNRYGQPGLAVTAKRSQLISIVVDPDWVSTMDAKYIAQDIVDCCDRIRARKPVLIHDAQLDRESDSELATRVVRHKRTLL
ncbi:hypothetical protein [Nocardia sp. CA-290969]|uniref:hypothetical protein n=1 Tax=Nocardia sp. CA-290969 TaxID=3239986 RepID=UPI003D8EFCAB